MTTRTTPYDNDNDNNININNNNSIDNNTKYCLSFI